MNFILPKAEQQFEDYKSKYLDLYDKVKSDHQKEKVSILEDVDFESELIHRDDINVAYIPGTSMVIGWHQRVLGESR